MDDFLDVADIVGDTGDGNRGHEIMEVKEHEVRYDVLLVQPLVSTIEPSQIPAQITYEQGESCRSVASYEEDIGSLIYVIDELIDLQDAFGLNIARL